MRYPKLLSLEDFLSISARINYLLAAKEPSWVAILDKILAGRTLSGSQKALEVGVAFLVHAYDNRHRRLGPLAVIHPLRVAYALSLVTDKPDVLDLLTIFLHDYYEDIYTAELTPSQRTKLENGYNFLRSHLSDEDSWFLDQRIQWLTRQHHEEYHEYLGRLLLQSRHTPQLIWVKLADRLDNTYDLRVVDEGSDDYFRMIFDALFLPKDERSPTIPQTPTPGQMDEARRLYQMFKNAVFLTLVRRQRLDSQTLEARRLFDSLAAASVQESGRILMQIFNCHVIDRDRQRHLLEDAKRYCQSGGINRVTPAGKGHLLDGLFKQNFDHAERKAREDRLDALQQNKELMIEACVAFLSIFESFLTSEQYHLSGVHTDGLSVEDTMV